MRSLTAAPVALLLALLAGCSSGHEVDEAAWEADVTAALGHAPEDFPVLQEIAEDLCDDDERAVEAFVAVTGGDTAQIEVARLGFKHACPDGLERFDEAVEEVQGSVADFDRICALPESARSEDERLMAEAYGC